MYKFVLTVLAVFFLTIAVAQTPVDCIEADFNNVVHSAYRYALPNNTPTVSCYVLEDATLEQAAIVFEADSNNIYYTVYNW